MQRQHETAPAHEREGPYVQLACFCERVIEDKQGVLTLVRVIDHMVVRVPAVPGAEGMPPVQRTLTLVIGLKAGHARGSGILQVAVEGPDGTARRGSAREVPILFDGDDGGVNVVIDTGVLFDREGVYWFAVRCDGQLLTRVPFRVIYQPASTREQAP